jgi:hypothetical protein
MKTISKVFHSIFGKKSRDYFTILSIDGGGIRGVFPVNVLKNIKNDMGTDFSKEFDLVAGTSTGSIIAASLATGFPLDQVVDMYENRAAEIFKNNKMAFKGIRKSKYSNKKFILQVYEALGNTMMDETKTDLILTSADITEGKPVIFDNTYKDLTVSDAVIASCSAPVYFKPHRIGGNYYIDGGIWASNPTLVSIIHAMKKYNLRLEDIAVMSLGTGYNKAFCFNGDIASMDESNWGALRWGNNLRELLLVIPKRGADKLSTMLLDKKRYLRLDFVTQKKIPMDDLASIPALKRLGKRVYNRNKRKIRRFLE